MHAKGNRTCTIFKVIGSRLAPDFSLLYFAYLMRCEQLDLKKTWNFS